jgi:L-asparaginase II
MLDPYIPLVHLTRADVVESIHYGAIAIVDVHGNLRAWAGDPNVVTFLRSSAKPFQVLPFLEHGGQAFYDLSSKEVAILCASHSGTDDHFATVSSIQAKAGILESDLLCGVHPLTHQPTIEALAARGEELTPNRHNCSGKHTGMIAYARMLNLPYRISDHAYIEMDHPIQQEILQVFAAMCGLDSTSAVHVGIDGCSAPNFAVSLRAAARAFARLCQPDDLPIERAQACRLVVDSMTSHPEMVGGPNSFDTHLMRVIGHKVVTKGGAEGYQAFGIRPGAMGPGSPALGVTYKVADGDLGSHTHGYGDHRGRARPLITLEILRQLGVITPEELAQLSEYGPGFPIFNNRKIHVGDGFAAFTLEQRT